MSARVPNGGLGEATATPHSLARLPASEFRIAKRRFVLLMLAPATIVLLALTLYPFLASFWYSLTDYSLLEPNDRDFIGLDNYVSLLRGTEFWAALRVTVGGGSGRARSAAASANAASAMVGVLGCS